MALRSGGRKLSFEILSQEDQLLVYQSNTDQVEKPSRKKKKHKSKKNKKEKSLESCSTIAEDPITETSTIDSNDVDSKKMENGNAFLENRSRYDGGGGGGGSSVSEVTECQSFYGELRQRCVNGVGGGGEETLALSSSAENGTEESGVEVTSGEKQQWRSEPNGSVVVPAMTKLETAESLDWKKLMAEDPHCKSEVNLFYLFIYFHFIWKTC